MTKASQIINVPYIVADAMLGSVLEELAEPPTRTWVWQPLTHGSSRHRVRQRGRNYLLFSVYAIANERTEITLDVHALDYLIDRAKAPTIFTEAMQIATETAQTMLSHFCSIIVDENANRQAGIEEMYRELSVLLPEPKRPGPKPKSYTRWAREQARAGRTIDDMLDEYMRQRGRDPADQEQRARSRDVLRRTLSRA
jgi:hypothetical protein